MDASCAPPARSRGVHGGDVESGKEIGSSWGKGPLNEVQWVVLRYADAMTRNVKVKEELFAELRDVAGFNEKEIVELTATVAGYNCASRFLVALDIGEMNGNEAE